MQHDSLQILCQLNKTEKVVELLCKNEDPNTCLGTYIKPVLWAAYNSNIELIAILHFFGGANTNFLKNLYPSLDKLVRPGLLQEFPELSVLHSVCPIEFLLKVCPCRCDMLIAPAIRFKRLMLKENPAPLAKLLFYIRPGMHDILCRKGKGSVFEFFLCAYKQEIPIDVLLLIINFMHAYDW